MDEATTKAVVLAACIDIRQTALEATGLAEGARACAIAGNHDGAIQILLDLEPKLGGLQRLLDLASFAKRRFG
jgi:hypothetical protein